jgi:predicted transposase/invertase (TIGR01784 family)
MGLEQGRIEERNEMARKLKSLGVSIDVIVQASGLTDEQVMYL